MASKRRQILAALAGKIDNITVANGYNNTVKLNSLKFRNLEQEPSDSFPAITYVTGPSAYFPLTDRDYTSGASQTGLDGWDIGVMGYLQTDTDTGQGTSVIYAMEDLIEDIIMAVLEDPTLGLTFVQNTYLTEVAQYFDYIDRNIGVVVARFSVKYDFDKDAP